MSRLLSTAIVLFFVALPAVALARPRVALSPLDNDSTGDVQDAVTDALDGGEITVVGPKQFTRALDKLGLDAGSLSERDLKKLSTELEADAVVQETLSAKGSNKLLHIKLWVHGKKKKGFKVEFASAKSAKFKHALHDKLLQKLGIEAKKASDDDVAAADAADSKPEEKISKKKKRVADDDAAPTDDDKPTKKKKDKEKDKEKSADDDSGTAAADDDKPAKKKHASDDDSDTASSDDKPAHKKDKGGDDDTASDDDHPRKASKRSASADDDDSTDVRASSDDGRHGDVRPANRFAVRVDAGVSVTARSLTFNSRPGLMDKPPGYKNSPVPGARVEGELYPLAFGNPRSVAAGLGVGFTYDKTLSLNLQNSAQPGTKFPANEMHYGVGPRFRYVFGDSDTSASLTVGVDYGTRMFTISRGALMPGNVIDVPDVQYKGFTPQVELRVPLAPAVALVFGGGTMLMTSAGPIQNPDQYGRAKVTEGEGRVGLDVVISHRFALLFTGEFAQVGFQFTGTGQQAINRDMDPGSIDVGGAADRYIGGSATFSVLY